MGGIVGSLGWERTEGETVVRRGLRTRWVMLLVVLVGGAVLAPPSVGVAAARTPVVEGLFDVGGYRLYLR